MISLTVSKSNLSLPTASGLILVRVRAVNDAPVLTLPGEIYADGSSLPNSPFNSTDPSDRTNLLSGDRLSPLVVDTLTLYISEDTPYIINNISVRDIDCTVETYLRCTITAKYGTVSITLPEIDPLENVFPPSSGLGLGLGLLFEEGTGILEQSMTFIGSLTNLNKVRVSVSVRVRHRNGNI
jgi:hypothetical protein